MLWMIGQPIEGERAQRPHLDLLVAGVLERVRGKEEDAPGHLVGGELAAQVQKELEWLFAAVGGLRIESVTGGTHVGSERRRLARRQSAAEHAQALVPAPPLDREMDWPCSVESVGTEGRPKAPGQPRPPEAR